MSKDQIEEIESSELYKSDELDYINSEAELEQLCNELWNEEE